ncbi:MAG: FAD binding domain-containing protein, partial [Acidobacteriota bacterium]
TVNSLSNIAELRCISPSPGNGLRIGTMTPIAAVAAYESIRSTYQALAQAASVVASPQLRSQGTLGGNLCQKTRCWYYRGDFPCLRKGGDQCFAYDGENQYHAIFGGEGCYMVHPSDTAPALAALGGVCRISGGGSSRSVPVDQFLMPASVDPQRETVLEPAEILTEILLPPAPPGLRSSYRKIRSRQAWDFALAGVALALEFDGDVVRSARVFLSGAAPTPWRAHEVEAVITGGRLDAETISKASKATAEGAEPLEHNGAKIALFEGLVTEALETIS